MYTNLVWEKPQVEDLGKAQDLIQDIFVEGTGDLEANMSDILAHGS